MELREFLLSYLYYCLFPVWLIAGVGDYLCHRRSAIERTSGTMESGLHLVQAGQLGLALLAGLVLDINALVLLLMISLVLAHTLTAFWDVSYSTSRRYIAPIEQHIHSYLEILPIVAVSIVAALHWEQFIAVFGGGAQSPRFALQLKSPPLPSVHLAIVLGAVCIFQIPLVVEEWLRCRRGRSKP